MPIRRLNYTKRRKLNREQVRITLSPADQDQPRTFSVEFNLPAFLPGSARIFVEAYRTSPAARMRFPFGTVDSPRHPAPHECLLTDFAHDLPPLFRVKITDFGERRGTLIADVQRIQPVLPDDQPDHRTGILYTAWRNNDGLVWELEYDDSLGPILYIDDRADPFHDLPTKIEFKALVYPEIMRQALTEALRDGHSIEDVEGWQSKWISFPRIAFGFTEALPADGEREEWIDAAVRWCARKAGFAAALAPAEVE